MVANTVFLGPSTFGATDPSPLNLLKDAGCLIKENPYGRKLTRQELAELLSGVQGIIAGLEPLDRSILANSKLKVISRCGAGMDNVDQVAARELGILVYNTPFGPTQAVAELTVGCLLALIRKVNQMDRALHQGQWSKQYGRLLQGMKVLIVGYGRIGRKVGEMLRALGAVVVASDPCHTGDDNCPAVSDISKVLPEVDVVTLHCSGEQTVLSAGELKLLKPGAFVLNAGRGGLVDEAALAGELDSGRVAGAWLDVFGQEPYQGPLAAYEQVILTPHIGSYAVESRVGMEMESAANLLEGLRLQGLL